MESITELEAKNADYQSERERFELIAATLKMEVRQKDEDLEALRKELDEAVKNFQQHVGEKDFEIDRLS
jgi:hypothetical protein